MERDVPLYSERQGDDIVARFGGAEVPLLASDFPATPTLRVPMQTGSGTGSFRIPGYVQVSKIPLYTRERVPVVAEHVWIGIGRTVTFVSASPGRLTVKKRLQTPIQQALTGSAPCSAFTLASATQPAWNVPGEARGYVLKSNSLELFNSSAADRTSVFTLQRAPDSTGVLLWSTERRQGFVHVEYHGDLIIDAWARAADLQALPPGETMDQLRPPVVQHGTPRLSFQTKPTLVRSTKLIPIRINAKDSAKIIGHIEPDTELYLLDTIAGWASALPRSLNLLPHGDNQFWIKSADVENTRAPAAEGG
jgi:hypothetical protein